MGVSAKIYAEELQSYGHGLPLWTPEPDPQDSYEVRIGDVGHIDDHGQFHRLFNVTVGQDHPYNEGGLPQNFERLTFHPRLLYMNDRQLFPGAIMSKGVKKRELGANVGANPVGFVGGDLTYKFACTKNQGAILVLKDPAKRAAVPPSCDFTSYIRRNHDSWYEFATKRSTRGLLCQPGDILLVRGTLKTRSWALAAYTDNGDQVSDASFNTQVGPLAQAGFHWSSARSSMAQFEHRFSSSAERALSRRKSSKQGKSIQRYEHELPEVVAEQTKSEMSTADSENPDDQCVFLQYWKIKYRIWPFKFKKLIAGAGPDTLPGDEDPSHLTEVMVGDEDGHELDIELESVPGQFKPHTPVDDVLNYILEFSDATVAIASDGDVVEALEGKEMPEDFAQYLQEMKPKIDVDEDGTGALSIEEAIRRARYTDMSRADQYGEQLAEQRAAEMIREIEEKAVQAASQQHTAPEFSDAGGSAPGEGGPHDSSVEENKESGSKTSQGSSHTVEQPPDPSAVLSSVLSSVHLSRLGSSMAAAGRLVLPKRGNQAPRIDWPHAMFMDKSAEGASVTDLSVCEREDGRYAATGCEDCIVRIWDLERGALICRLDRHEDTVWAIAFSPDGSKLVSGSADHKAILWDVESKAVIGEMVGHRGDVWTIAYSLDGKYIATGCVDSTVGLWNGLNGENIALLTPRGGVVMLVLFSPDSKFLLTCANKTAHLYDTQTRTFLRKLEGHTGLIWDLDFTADSARIVTASEDHTARVWATETGDELCTLREHTGPVWTAKFSPDGKEIASGSYDCTLAISDSFTGEQHHILGTENASVVSHVAYSKDGYFIAGACADGTVKLWDAKSGARIAEFLAHEDKVKKVVFMPGDDKLVSSSDDGTVRVWNLLDVLRL